MPDWRDEIRARLAPLGLRPEREAEIVEELAQHLDDRYRESLTAGHDETIAAAAAWQELERLDVLGRELAASEQAEPAELAPPGSSQSGWWPAGLWQDLRHGLRSLRKQPIFTATVLVALALSVGPVTAALSLGSWLLWPPLPGVHDPDRLGVVRFGSWNVWGVAPMNVPYADVAELKGTMKTAVGLAGVEERSATLLAGDNVPRGVGLAYVTADFFSVLGVRLAAGRAFRADEDRLPLGAPVAVISEALARAQFGSATGALERRLVLNRHPLTVIGVAGDGFRGVTTSSNVDVWITGATFPYLGEASPGFIDYLQRNGRFDQFVARLAPAADFRQLEAELGLLVPRLADLAKREVAARVFPKLGLDPFARFRMRVQLYALQAVCGVLLLLGCANVANLLIARAIRREPEMATRKALGATPFHLMQGQLVHRFHFSARNSAS